MVSNTALYGYKDRELQALKHELDEEVLNDSNSIGVEFHDREDLVYERSAGELISQCFCLELLNVPPRGGEFLHE